jgi:hypothetical protein
MWTTHKKALSIVKARKGPLNLAQGDSEVEPRAPLSDMMATCPAHVQLSSTKKTERRRYQWNRAHNSSLYQTIGSLNWCHGLRVNMLFFNPFAGSILRDWFAMGSRCSSYTSQKQLDQVDFRRASKRILGSMDLQR